MTSAALLAVVFLRPWLLVLLVLVPLAWFVPRRLRDPWQGALRSLVLSLAVLALCGPLQIVHDRREHHVVVADLSASADPAERAAAAEVAARLPRHDRGHVWHLIEIGGELPPPSRAPYATVEALTGSPATPLSSALRLATLRIPPGASAAVTLLSDGLATDRGWSSAMQELSARGIPLHTIALAGRAGIRPVALFATEPLRTGQTARLYVDVVGGEARLRVVLADQSGGTLATSEPFDLRGRQRVALAFEPPAPGFLELTARIEVESGSDPTTDDDAISGWFAVQDPFRVLYLGGRVTGSKDKLGALLGKGFTLEEAPVQNLPLMAYDLAMVDDRRASELPLELQRQIVDAVQAQGLGLVMSGGQAAFGPGGYHQTPIEDVLPVELVQKEEKKDPSTALAVIIDTSGSMVGPRIDLAKEVARLAIRRLLPHDKVGIVEFFGNKRWAAPLQSAANAIDIERALNRLDAGGGTILLPAIEEAYYGLRNVQTRYKHVLILTDAGVETGDYERMLRRMARDGICVSTVLVGAGRHSEFLVELASWGNGRFYNAADRYDLPEILLKQPSSARLPAERTGPHALQALGGRGWWGDLDPASVPPLASYVETRRRPGADVVLATRDERHPILASWTFGLGQVTALTTEPTGPGSETWRDWPGYGAFLGRALSRTAPAGRLPFRFELERRDHRLTLRATRRTRGNELPVAFTLEERGNAQEPLPLRERAPGVFEAAFDRAPSAVVRVLAGTNDAALGSVRLVSRPREGVAPELQVDPSRGLDLTAAAHGTGGQSLRLSEAAAFHPVAAGAKQPWNARDLAPLCLLLALSFYLLEVAWRRSPWQRAKT